MAKAHASSKKILSGYEIRPKILVHEPRFHHLDCFSGKIDIYNIYIYINLLVNFINKVHLGLLVPNVDSNLFNLGFNSNSI